MKPIIGIPGNERTMIDHDAHWISYIPRNFVTGIEKPGGLALILPIGDPTDAKAYIDRIDKLLLAGGQDVAPQFYQESYHPLIQATNPERDAFELALIKEAIAQGKPILGVCRGMQLLNVAFGGTLYQDLTLMEKPVLKHVQLPTAFHFPTHKVTLTPESRLGKLLGTEYMVNSFHHQVLKKIAAPFQVVAKAEDGIVEAVETEQFAAPIVGIQWHPELTAHRIADEQRIFDYFVQEL